ncbi:MAG: DUF4258 domain-containing protein [Chloroflexi bacterium]|nr:DUF4258 domain-containing protein [Chloroflexota bacterium]
MQHDEVIFRVHALVRMLQRDITDADVLRVLVEGEAIEEYLDDLPFPSRLILGWSGPKALHVVAAYDAARRQAIIVTVYEPDPKEWTEDFRRRL